MDRTRLDVSFRQLGSKKSEESALDFKRNYCNNSDLSLSCPSPPKAYQHSESRYYFSWPTSSRLNDAAEERARYFLNLQKGLLPEILWRLRKGQQATTFLELMTIRALHSKILHRFSIGTSVGFRIRKGVLTDIPAILVFVARKVHKRWLTPIQCLPAAIEGPGGLWCDVDVVEFSYFGAPAPIPKEQLYTELIDGLTGSDPCIGSGSQVASQGTYGTLGAIVQSQTGNRQLGFLTNRHEADVLDPANQKMFYPLPPNLGPGVYLGAVERATSFITDDLWYGIFAGTNSETFVRADGAFIAFAEDFPMNDVTTTVKGVGDIGDVNIIDLQSPINSLIGRQVVKVGRSSGLTTGTIMAYALEHNDEKGTSFFTDFLIVGENQQTFTLEGDSGSLILLTGQNGEKPRPVGIIWGGTGNQGWLKLKAGQPPENWTSGVDLGRLLRLLELDLITTSKGLQGAIQLQQKESSDQKDVRDEENSKIQTSSERHGLVIDVQSVKSLDSSEHKKFEIDEIWSEASQTRQPEGIQVEKSQLQALSTLKPQGVVFDVEAVKILKSSGQMEFQIEDVKMEPEASEQHVLFLVQGGLGLSELPKDEDWKNSKEIYLMDNDLSVLPENPRCPNLSALFLPRNYKLRLIPPSFFDNMPALQILNLSRTGIKSLPDSVVRLVSLKRLFLNDCHRLMKLSPKVGDLEQLEVLDLEGARIMDLPKEIKNLTNLTCLEVSFYGYTSNDRRAMQSNVTVPCGVICLLSKLEELNIDVNPGDKRWDACVKDIVNDVCTLKRLETLKFYFPKVELLSHFQWNSLSLSHFRFTVGHHVKRFISRVPPDVEFELERWERCLKYINGVGVPRDIKNVLQHVTAFFLDRHATIKKLSDFGIRNMKQLKCCVVGECNELQVIVDAADAYGEDDISEIVSSSYDAERNVFGSLEYLYIYYMKSLRSIWEGLVQQNSLSLLKSLTLRTCPQLTTIFTQGLLDSLCNLEELKVEDCCSIKSIVSCEISAEDGTSFFLPNLKKLSLHYMPGLVSISSGLHIAPKLEWLSFYNCPDLKNPLIDEISGQDLKKIKGERSWWEALEWSNGRPGYLDEIFVQIDI